MNMEHVEVLRDLSEVCRAAIKAGDWKVDGACDLDSLLRHADAAIASLSVPQSGDWVLVPREPTEAMVDAFFSSGHTRSLSELGHYTWQGDCGNFSADCAAMLAAAPQPPAEAQPVGSVVWSAGVENTVIEVEWSGGVEPPVGTKLYAAPPSAPVGVEGLVETWEKRAGELNDEGLYGCCAETYEQCAAQVRALAQQPAAEAIELTVCCGREECGGECGHEWRGMEWVRKDTLPPAEPFVCTGDEIRCYDGNGCECAMQGKQPPAEAQPVANWCRTCGRRPHDPVAALCPDTHHRKAQPQSAATPLSREHGSVQEMFNPGAPVGVPVDVVREYLDARACYDPALRHPNSPEGLRLREARNALDAAIALAQQPAAVDGESVIIDGRRYGLDTVRTALLGLAADVVRDAALAAQPGGSDNDH